MKPMKIKRWKIIFFMTILVFIGIGETFIWYYSNNFMYIKIWHQRLKNGGTFRLEGLEIKIPENCAIQSSKTIETSEEAWFICATSPVNFSLVSISKSILDNNESLQKAKNYSEEFSESNEYIYTNR
jgi:hypothetical protein